MAARIEMMDDSGRLSLRDECDFGEHFGAKQNGARRGRPPQAAAKGDGTISRVERGAFRAPPLKVDSNNSKLSGMIAFCNLRSIFARNATLE